MTISVSRLLALGVLLGAPALAAMGATAPKCSAQLITELDLVETPDGSFLVPLSIEGKPVWMVLETGSSLTMLFQPAIDQLQLKTSLVGTSGSNVTVGKDRITHKTILNSLVAGDHRYLPLIAGVMPGTQDDPLHEVEGKPVVGYLGTEALSRTDFELHLARRKLRLFSAEHCRGVGAYWTTEYAETGFGRDPYGGIYFAMGLEGKLVETSMSTASPQTTLATTITRRAYGFDASSPGVEVEGDGRASFRAMAVTMPGLTLGDLRIRLVPGHEECGYRERIDSGSKAIAYDKCLLTFPMRLGRDVLRQMRLYVALKERKIYFSEAGAGR